LTLLLLAVGLLGLLLPLEALRAVGASAFRKGCLRHRQAR